MWDLINTPTQIFGAFCIGWVWSWLLTDWLRRKAGMKQSRALRRVAQTTNELRKTNERLRKENEVLKEGPFGGPYLTAAEREAQFLFRSTRMPEQLEKDKKYLSMYGGIADKDKKPLEEKEEKLRVIRF